MNIFGKHRNADNRAAALTFFELIIKTVAPSPKGAESLQKLLCALMCVIEHWKPLILSASMAPIVDLIHCVDKHSGEHSRLLITHYARLMNALKKVVVADKDFVPDLVLEKLSPSDSNLSIKAVCDLIWKLLQSPFDGALGAKMLDDAAFYVNL